MADVKPKCPTCKEPLGPDIHGKPCCYRCAPLELLPSKALSKLTMGELSRRSASKGWAK